jgi:hypothetical protein
MNYEVQAGIDEQSKVVTVNTKIRIGGDGNKIDKEYLNELLTASAEAAIKEFELLRPYAEGMTLRKIGR